MRLLKQQMKCKGRETSSYRGGSGGSGSSTGTPGDTVLYKRKSFMKHTNSVVVTKTTLTEINSCRRMGSSGSRSSVNSMRDGSVPGPRRLSQLASSIFIRNSALTAAASTCCRVESDDSDIPRNTFRYDTAGPYRGLNRAGAIRKKTNIEEASNVKFGSESGVDVTKGRRYYAYSLTPKERTTSCGNKIMEDADPAEVDVTDQVMALLHGEPEAGRRMQVQF